MVGTQPTKVSLIVVTRNQEEFLGKTISSALVQTLSNIELIIWDMGSTDKTVDVARSFSDPRIKVIAASGTERETALAEAHKIAVGEYVGLLDGSDILFPQALEVTVALLDKRPDVGFCYTDYLVIDENDKIKGYGQTCTVLYSKQRLLLSFLTFHFRLVRRSYYTLVGGIDPEMKEAAEWDLCLKLSEVGECYHIKTPLYRYRSCQTQLENLLAFFHWSEIAVNRALVRRGLDKNYVLEPQVRINFSLRKRFT